MLGDCGYARLSESGFNERFTLCSGRALKRNRDRRLCGTCQDDSAVCGCHLFEWGEWMVRICFITFTFRFTTSSLKLKRNQESCNCYSDFERNGEKESNCLCGKKVCLVWESLTCLGALTKQVFHRTRHDKHCKMCKLIVKAWHSQNILS